MSDAVDWEVIEREVRREKSAGCSTVDGTENVTTEWCFVCGASPDDRCILSKLFNYKIPHDYIMLYLRAREAARG